ncbi:Protein of unknown function [Pyronema omphalodes CBS 100304]|uniref:Uncharacterized protein n=1 Tax=Pyronema omphalodes (strain CBS 100304) TaxID=1076935 RepID=U4LBE1_PYROM|nr:Protein of unknown function [Pyronema omphalodes CBS 100304]
MCVIALTASGTKSRWLVRACVMRQRCLVCWREELQGG